MKTETKEFINYLEHLVPEISYNLDYTINGKPHFLTRSYPKVLPPVYVLNKMVLEIQDRYTKVNSCFTGKLELKSFQRGLKRENGYITDTEWEDINIKRIPGTYYWKIIE